jgi:cation:H+ antiporter
MGASGTPPATFRLHVAEVGTCEQDGQDPCTLALANMTGANRLLIGIGWALVVLLAWYRLRGRGRSGGGGVQLPRPRPLR